MNAAALMGLLQSIDEGAIELHLVDVEHSRDTEVEFEAAGWRIWVFCDSGQWDYLDRVISPSGEERVFPINNNVDEIDDILEKWEPQHPERWAGME